MSILELIQNSEQKAALIREEANNDARKMVDEAKQIANEKVEQLYNQVSTLEKEDDIKTLKIIEEMEKSSKEEIDNEVAAITKMAVAKNKQAVTFVMDKVLKL